MSGPGDASSPQRAAGATGADRGAQANRADAVVGLQWGDEGKGKIVDLLARERDIVARYNGGANAGHSVVIDGKRHALHLIPAGALRPGVLAVIGNGVVAHPQTLIREMDELAGAGVDVSGVRLSSRAHLVMPYHIAEDQAREALLGGKGSVEAGSAGEASAPIGTTLRGIGPAYAEKMQRALAVRAGDLLRLESLRGKVELACALKAKALSGLGVDNASLDADAIMREMEASAARLAPCITDTTRLLLDGLDAGRRVLFEGANGALLDVDHGTYPFVTSSSASALGIGPGSGVPASRVGDVIGVVKAYCSRVGAGPFPTEDKGDAGERIRQRGREFGTTTGRPRRCGWLDLVALRYASRINGCAAIAVTLLDVLAGLDELRVCAAYEIEGERTEWFPADAETLAKAKPVYERLAGFEEDVGQVRRLADLPGAARAHLARIEEAAGAPVAIVSVGPDREETIEAG